MPQIAAILEELKALGKIEFAYMSLISSLLYTKSLIFGPQNALIMKISNNKLFTILGITTTDVLDNTINILKFCYKCTIHFILKNRNKKYKNICDYIIIFVRFLISKF